MDRETTSSSVRTFATGNSGSSACTSRRAASAIDAGGTAVLSTTAMSGTGHSLKMAVLAPIPSTSVSRPTAVNPGFFSRRRTA
jgi:hypothetical protein